ncbi:MAG: tRNA lysidine(34) synthetase TilS [Veillonellaceae bacterium]|nr:tRNA lysidine(34) synthetase TilS [Veillonellaceae bacterium]
MLEKIKGWIDKNRLLTKEDKIVAACSGGPDSLALVHILNILSVQYKFQLVVAHVDHMIRGEQSAADAAFVADFCAEYNLPFYKTSIDVPQYAKASGRSLEEEARERRYDFLRKVAVTVGGAKIATGHHADDQAETVLINLLRGAGSGGLRGMQAANGGIIRPLLAVSRSEIEAYCFQNQLSPRTDITNFETDFLRNRVRLQLVPLLEKEYNPAIKDTLFRTAAVIGEQHDYINKAAEQLWPATVTADQGTYSIDCRKLLSQHIALQRELLRLTVEKKQGNLKGITFSHVERLIMMAKNAAVGNIVELPGRLLVKKGYHELLVGWKPKIAVATVPTTNLTIPGITYIEQLAVKITAEICSTRPEKQGGQVGVFDWRSLEAPLYVRTRLPGDRFEPLGLKGTKKLKDFFIDAKVPQEERDSILLVCDKGGIIWVTGYRQAERGRVIRTTTQFLQLTIQQLK